MSEDYLRCQSIWKLKVTPLNRRRLDNFKKNRRGFWSLWIFLLLFALSLFAELIANDKPYLVWHKGEFFFPAIFEDYTDVFVQELIEKDGWLAWPIVRFSYDTIDKELTKPAPSPPDTRHWLGTDDQARDVLARLIYGFRLSVLFGLILTTLSSIIGIIAGAIQGYYGGLRDLFFQRFIEIWAGMPQLYILIIMSSILVPGFWVLLVILLLFSWLALVGVVRAEFLRARNLDFVRAARALGVSDSTIIFRHVLPNAMVATITMLPFILTGGVTALTSLDFLGLGLPPGSPSLGELLNQGKNNLQAPWLGLSGFFVLALMLSLLIFIGEGVRDAFDPRKTFE